MLRKVFVIVVGAAFVLALPVVRAQPPSMTLTVSTETASPGEMVTLHALLDNPVDEVVGWSFGICHDPAKLTLINAMAGSAPQVTQASSGGFVAINEYADGVTMFLLISIISSDSIPAGTSGSDLLAIDYLVALSASAPVTVEPCTTLGSPPASVEFVVGGFPVYPAEFAGGVLLGGPPPELFERGDANVDDVYNIADIIFLLGSLFVGGSPPLSCDDSGDINDDGVVNIADAVFGLSSLFVPGSPAPPAPAPGTGCGVDPTADGLTCATFAPCP